MIVHEVEPEMDAALRNEYLARLYEHVHEMQALHGFIGAEVLIRSEPPPPAECFVVQAHYRLRDRAMPDGCLTDRAPRVREAGLMRVGPRVRGLSALPESP